MELPLRLQVEEKQHTKKSMEKKKNLCIRKSLSVSFTISALEVVMANNVGCYIAWTF